MYKLFDKIINDFIYDMKNWWVELFVGGQSKREVKIQRDIFQGDSLLPLLFVMAMISFNQILRKYTGATTFQNHRKRINHLMYLDDIKVFAKMKRELENLTQIIRTYSQYTGMETSI